MKKLIKTIAICCVGVPSLVYGQSDKNITEQTPSKSEYFSWINHTNEGPTEEQTVANLKFFQWLHDTYGMNLDIYAFDAGTLDGRNYYGSMEDERFKKRFPHGFDLVYSEAKKMNTQLGIWGGPDGFGTTDSSISSRKNMIVSLCKDYEFGLFKFDAVCGVLRKDKQDLFADMMKECQTYSPELVVLNHRIDLGEKGKQYATTFLIDGAETYIDVHMANSSTASHHRVETMKQTPPENLTRLAEDHGVCISSCIDYWEDDLVLQAFNRNLILAPQIYGNPWLMKDEEFPKLAQLFNLHQKYREIMVNAKFLPESYGEGVVSRGNSSTRLITLKNLSWEKKIVEIDIKDLGLEDNGQNVSFRSYHPTQRELGDYDYQDKIQIEVLPFRACLIEASTVKNEELILTGIDYFKHPSASQDSVIIDLLGFQGEEMKIEVRGDLAKYDRAVLENKSISKLLKNRQLKVKFEGEPFVYDYHRKIGEMQKVDVPEDVVSLYEATQFEVDNNSLEARSLKRSGDTKFPAVQAARDAFFEQKQFLNRET
ncbi:hypothetical protein KMW28_25665 [Flammeovirga yaeyamensis]|uniref:Uncharacterized protein n=1 Tax=Flammeovirga yaeyamensis TaxID=367791 RepID=A0AAX1N9M0_9BACT|nr:hypothetical protein [Flammeovirga yaeyamensis]MBB3699314.1 hypothetical protein [Flammeovirga yaeyamensis]NMF35424.1 hypothetical protein [Flammeovirga yaeyamensis]QWG04284.1 hypothetical protein KMW28_25665 [Flammeovirga yaeyamensis]